MNEKEVLTEFIAGAYSLNEIHYYNNKIWLSLYPDRYVVEDESGRQEYQRYQNDPAFIKIIQDNIKFNPGMIT